MYGGEVYFCESVGRGITANVLCKMEEFINLTVEFSAAGSFSIFSMNTRFQAYSCGILVYLPVENA